MKVKLVFEKSYTEHRGLSSNTFSKDIDVELPQGIDMAHLVAAKCYDPKQSSNAPSGDTVARVWDYTDDQRLVGKLLTYIDATFVDKEQREAHKNLVKDLVYGYCSDLQTRAYQTVESQTDK